MFGFGRRAQDPVDYASATKRINSDLAALHGVESADVRAHDGGPFSDPAIAGLLLVTPGVDLMDVAERAYRTIVTDTAEWEGGRIRIRVRHTDTSAVIVNARDFGFGNDAVDLDEARVRFTP